MAIATARVPLLLVSADQTKDSPASVAGLYAAGSASESYVHFEFNATNINATLQYRAVAKRGMAQEATPEMFERYRCRGEQILDLMVTPKDERGTQIRQFPALPCRPR